MSTPSAYSLTVPGSIGAVDRVARSLVLRQMSGLVGGEIVLHDALGTTRLGQAADLRTTIEVRDPRFFRHALQGGSLAVAAAYFRGEWDCDSLTDLFRLFVRNRGAANRLDRSLARLGGWMHRLTHAFRANSKAGSRANIHAHYDLGNDFFGLWLDETLAYSCGMFPSPQATLAEASLEKFDRVCRKLDLRPTDHVLEIGTGWGGFALHAATHYGCRVTTATISRQQFDVARQRVAAANLADRVDVLLGDYRDLQGQFDKLVSIEMIEAVGYRYLDAYFRKCGELLKPEGTCLLQAIVMPERHYDDYLRSVDFIQRYIFPGGCLPSVAAVLESVGRSSGFRLVHAEDFAPHYAETLRRWHGAFNRRLDDVRGLGYGEEFVRLWNYYLCYCEAAFEERSVGLVQLVFDNVACRRDPLEITTSAARTCLDQTAACEAPRMAVGQRARRGELV